MALPKNLKIHCKTWYSEHPQIQKMQKDTQILPKNEADLNGNQVATRKALNTLA